MALRKLDTGRILVMRACAYSGTPIERNFAGGTVVSRIDDRCPEHGTDCVQTLYAKEYLATFTLGAFLRMRRGWRREVEHG